MTSNDAFDVISGELCLPARRAEDYKPLVPQICEPTTTKELGGVGARVRDTVSASCVVQAIRANDPAQDGQYRGYQETVDAQDLLCSLPPGATAAFPPEQQQPAPRSNSSLPPGATAAFPPEQQQPAPRSNSNLPPGATAAFPPEQQQPSPRSHTAACPSEQQQPSPRLSETHTASYPAAVRERR
ncbi:unnamed protein product [Boreogadus saida]